MSKYYSHVKAMSYNTPYIFTLGTRSIGKTFDYTEYCIDKYIKNKRKLKVLQKKGLFMRDISNERKFSNIYYRYPKFKEQL